MTSKRLNISSPWIWTIPEQPVPPKSGRRSPRRGPPGVTAEVDDGATTGKLSTKRLPFGSDIFVYRLLDEDGRIELTELDHIEGHLQAVDGIGFSRDGKLLASTSQDGSTRIWDISDLP